MRTKKKKTQNYLKKLLAMMLIITLVGTNLLTEVKTVYANESVKIKETAVADSQTVAEEETSVVDSTSEVSDLGETDEELTTSEQDTTDSDATNETQTSETQTDEAVTDETQTDEAVTDETVLADQKEYTFGIDGDIAKETLFDDQTGYGFSDATYPDEAVGWSSSIYYPREVLVSQSAASYVEDGNQYEEIKSKVWTETESTGYGVFTYENTSTLDFNLNPANYNVKVTLVNPTDSEISAYVEAEDITKVSDITIAAGETKEIEFTVCLIDEVLNLKFLAPSSATSQADASTKTVYVSNISFEEVENETGSKPTIFIASDSTVQTYDDYYYPQTGWGQTLYNFFGDLIEERECNDATYSQSQTYETTNAIIENRAIGGRSSKSFVEEGKLDDLLEDIKPGDYVLVQWGHNDATYSRPNRYVSSDDFEKWIQYYVDGATQRGATCILVTPVARYSYTTDDNGDLVSFASNFEAYRNVMQKIASEQNIPLVDLTGLSIDLCNSFGIEGAKSLFLQLQAGNYEGYYAGGVSDATHLQYYGAYKFAQCVAKGIVDNDALESLASLVTLTLPENTPATPTNLETSMIGASSISMTWDAVADAELYYVYRQELEDGQIASDVDFSNAVKYSVSSTTSYTDSGCEGGKTYVYAIAGFNELGLGELSEKITVSTKSAAYKFDFGIAASSNVLDGWSGVTENQKYAAEAGYGFITAPGNGRNRSNNGNADSSAMADDFCLGAGEFALDVANGDYEVTVYACDLLSGTSTIKASYTGEGVSIGTISTKQSLASMTATVRVTDGQLNIGIGGSNAYINGMEVTMQVHEHESAAYHVEIHDAETGKILMGYYTGKDTGRGVAADIDPTYPYAEFWSIASPSYVASDEPSWNSKDGGAYSTTSTLDNLVTTSSNSPASNFSIFWDGDLLSEIFDHTFDTVAYAPLTTTIAKWNYETKEEDLSFETDEAFTSNGTKGNAGLVADIMGDWREEIILRSANDNSKVRVYTTTIQTDYVVPCLMENLAYREGIAWQNAGYNQPANLSYLLSENVITSQVTVEATTKNSTTLNFTAANDGTYGHEIQGYEIYRAVLNGEYSKIATIENNNLSIQTGTSGSDAVYEYTDTTAQDGTSYLYKVAAIVDNKTSFMSNSATANTIVDIKKVNDIILADIVEDTVLEENQTVADLLPTTVTVIDSNDQEAIANVTWDVTKVDLTTPGSYKVYASVAGYSETVEATLTIIENTITGYTALENIKTTIGSEVVLPTTLEVTYLNGTTKDVNIVKWIGTYDNNTIGSYSLTAELEDTTIVDVTVTVIIVDDYVTSLTGTIDPIEVVINSTITSADLPPTIIAKYASGISGAAAISWNTDDLDTSKEGVITITGSVADYDLEVFILARIVKYAALYKFDFGISEKNIADGWTGITVNAKNETITAASLGIIYSSEKGYGFDTSDETILNGRIENYSYTDSAYPIPNKVYNDFALTAGLTFNVDVENGDYIVELMSTSSYKSDIKGTIEDSVSFSVANTASSYKIGSYEVTVSDGQLNIAFDSSRVSRLGSIIIRSISSIVITDPTEPTDPVVETYYVTFNSNGGNEVTSQKVETGTLVTKSDNPTKNGYTFEGWYKDSAFTTKWDFSSDKVTENTILYAKWNAVKVSDIQLNKKSVTIGDDTIFALISTVLPTDAANTEILWSSSNSKVANVSQSGIVSALKMGTTTITATSNDGSNISASCKITVGYKITYRLNGGTNNDNNPSGLVTKKTVKLKNPTKTGYLFKGWYIDKTFETKITKIKKGTKENLTVYAKWEKVTVDKVTIKALKNSGSKKLKVTINKVSGAKGYEIMYATDSKFTKDCVAITISGRSKTIKKLTKGTTYYVKVRAYQVDDSGNEIYGKYSVVKKIEIEK
ncbi:MAG: InlB B-repeat-containing protein [Lachnotalea sp.]